MVHLCIKRIKCCLKVFILRVLPERKSLQLKVSWLLGHLNDVEP